MTSSDRKRWLNPKVLPGVRIDQVNWTKKYAFPQWTEQQEMGTQFHPPVPVREKAAALVRNELHRYAKSRMHVSASDERKLKRQAEIAALANFEVERWRDASLYSVTPSMTAKAARTGMTEFYLPAAMLPSEHGVIFWQSPIGVAEYYYPMTRHEVNPETGVLSPMTYASLYNFIYDDSHTPVVAAAWSKLPDNKLWVVFYTDGMHHIDSMENLTPAQRLRMRAISPPLMFEREQILPLDEKRPWFTSEEPNRLIPTARGRARDGGSFKLAAERKLLGLPMIEQMTRTLAATLIYMSNANETREVVHPSRSVSKALRNAGAPSDLAESPVRVIKMGEPLRYRPPRRKEDAQWHWNERRVVAPYFRYRQYIPATGETREGIFEVSGYIAGPPDAPIRNIDKVFLLDR